MSVTIAENSTWDADLRCTSCSRACRLLAHCWCSKCLSWRQMKAVRMLQASLAWKLLPGTLFYAPGFSQICLVASFPFLTTSCPWQSEIDQVHLPAALCFPGYTTLACSTTPA